MGNSVNKQERQRREVIKDDIFNKRIEAVKREQYESVNEGGGDLVVYNNSFAQQLIGSTKIAQLERRGKILTKADLIAVLTKLESKPEHEALQYRTLSCDDLRAAIRLNIYGAYHNVNDGGILGEPMPSAPYVDVEDEPGNTQ